MADDYTAAPPIDDSLVGSPEYQDPGSGPVAPPSMQDMLTGAGTPPFVAPQTAPPDLSTPGQRPGYAGNINGQTGQAIPPAPPQNKWERLFQTIAVGLSGSGGAKNFAEGLAGGAKAQQGFQQQQIENQQNQQKLAMEQQRSMDEHQVAQAQLATAHLNQQVLAAQYNTMPKSTQDILDQVMYKQGAELQSDPNAKSIFTGSYNDAVARSQDEMTQKGGNSPLNVRVLKNPDGTFSVWDVNNPDKLNDKPQDVVIGYDFNTGKPQTKTYAPGTITYAQKSQMETNAAMNVANANNQLEIHKKQSAIDTAAAGQKAYLEQKGKNKADQESLGTLQDSFGNPIAVTPEGTRLSPKEYTSRSDKFAKDYVQPLGVLQKTTMEFNRINNNPNQTGAEKVTALLNAVGISGDPLKGKGFRISSQIINEHAEARNIWESGVQKLNTIAGSGGPITSKQIADYTAVAEGVVHDAYVTAAQEARRQGLPVNFLPKPTQQGQVPDKLTAQIYLDSEAGNIDAAHKALLAAGYK